MLPTCLQPPWAWRGPSSPAHPKHGVGGPTSTLREDQLSYLAWSGCIPPALPTDGQSPDPVADMGRGPLPGFSPLAPSPRGKASLPAPPEDRPAFCKASATLPAMRSQCPAHGQAMRPQQRPMPARLFSLKFNKKATLKLPGAAGEVFLSATRSERTSRLSYQRGGSQAVPLAGTLPLRSPACSLVKGCGAADMWAVQASSVAQHHPGHHPWGDIRTRQELGSCTQKVAEDAGGGHGHMASDVSSERLVAPCTALQKGLPAQGHLAKGRARAMPTLPGPGR